MSLIINVDYEIGRPETYKCVFLMDLDGNDIERFASGDFEKDLEEAKKYIESNGARTLLATKYEKYMEEISKKTV